MTRFFTRGALVRANALLKNRNSRIFNVDRVRASQPLKALGTAMSSLKPGVKLFERKDERFDEATSRPVGKLSVKYKEFLSIAKKEEDEIDQRVWPIAISTFLMGASISCIVPVLPLLATELGLSAGQYGYVMSVVGFSRVLANIPLTCLIDSKGRRPFLFLGPILTAASMFGFATATGVTQLVMTRFMSGISSAGQMIAAQLYLSDISKPSNRARTLAPNFIAWNCGFILGPVIGGFLAEAVSIRCPFFLVGSVIGGVGVLNFFTLPETAKDLNPHTNISGQISLAVEQWKSLIRQTDVALVVLLQASFWGCMSGVQFCLFPIYTTQTLGFTAMELASCYVLSGLLNIGLSKPSAWLSDKFGRKRLIVPACCTTVVGLSLIPFCTSYWEIIASVFVSSFGNAVLSTNPRAYLIDLVSEKERSQALALVSSGGDVGLFLGAMLAGGLAELCGLNVAVHTCTSLLGISVARFALKARNS